MVSAKYIEEDASRTAQGGSGLGLFIAKKVAERHGGRIYYEKYEKGKAFVIELEL